jgi:hypothetical protein
MFGAVQHERRRDARLEQLSIRQLRHGLQPLVRLAMACLAALTLVGSACSAEHSPPCDNDKNKCPFPDRPYCDIEGVFPESSGISRTCIPDPYVDAGVDATP